jgi:hypothetical protein
MVSFGTAITCIDGRIQLPVAEWLKREYALDFVDIISEPGVDREVAHGWIKVLDLKAKAQISAKAHGSRTVAVAGHEDCAANPASHAEHQQQIGRAVQVVHEWRMFDVVLGLWVSADGQVELVDAREAAR